MGSESSSKLRRLPLVFVAGAVFASLAAASGAMAAGITFLAPREAAVRHNGTLVRCLVKSISQDEVVVILKGAEKSYAMSAITSIIAADGTFRYMPAQETLDEFLVRSASVRGATIVRDDVPPAGSAGGSGEPRAVGGISNSYARMIGMQPPANPQIASTSGGFQQAGGFAGASQRPQGLARLEAPVIPELDKSVVDAMAEERKAAALDAVTPKFAVPGFTPPKLTKPEPAASGSGEIFICSNPKCQKEVPNAKYGEKCPYCGITWAAQSSAELHAAAPGSNAVDPKNPFAKGSPAGGDNAAQAGGGQAVPAAAPPVPDVAAAAPEGFSLETIPWWGKLLGFGASIMVLMYIMGRR